jgi:hypothetical protein
MATIPVKDANNATVDLEKPLPPGRAAAVSSRPVALSSEDLTALVAIHDAVVASGGTAPPSLGRKAATGSSPVVLSNEDLAAIQAIAGGSALTPGRKAATGSSPVVLSNEDFAALSPTPGRAAAAASRPVVLSTEDLAALSNPSVGRKAAAASLPIVFSTEDLAAISAISSGGGGGGTVTIGDSALSEYETVAAGATDQALGATGATGDYLAGVLIVPATTSPGAVSLKDGSGSAITIFTGGASSVSNLVPFFVPLGIKSNAGAWKISAGTSVSVVGVGNFT